MKSLKINLRHGDKFVAYDRKTGRKALWGGVCTVKDFFTNKGEKRKAVTRAINGKWTSVNAVDSNGNERLFSAAQHWGFLDRT